MRSAHSLRSGGRAVSRLGLAATLAALSLAAPPATHAQNYTITGLGSFGTDSSGSGSSSAKALNAAGQVTGLSVVYDAGHNATAQDAFLYSGGTLHDLGNFGTDSSGYGRSNPIALNASGQVTGYSAIYDSSHNAKGQDAFLYSGGVLKDLGNLGTSSGIGSSQPVALNAAGQVAGNSTVYDSSHNAKGQDAFLYTGGVLKDLGNFGTDVNGRSLSAAVALNDAGQVIGNSSVYDAAHNAKGQDAFLYSGGVLKDLGNLGTDGAGSHSSSAVALNASGQVAGNSSVYDAAHNAKGSDAFLYSNGVLVDLGNLGTDSSGSGFSSAVALNAAGQVAGNSSVYDAAHNAKGSDAFLYSNGVLVDLGNLGTNSSGYGSSAAVALNAAGQVIGHSSVFDAAHNSIAEDAFLYSSGVMHDLGNFGTDSYGDGSSTATAFNNAGQVIGYSDIYDGSGNYKGTDYFLYSNGVLSDLNTLFSGSGWTKLSATAINDAGQIAGTGLYNGQQEAFLMSVSPAPEPSSLVAFAAGGLGLARLAFKHRRRAAV